MRKDTIEILNNIAYMIKEDINDDSRDFDLYEFEGSRYEEDINRRKEELLKEDILIDLYENLEILNVENKSRYIVHCEDLRTGTVIDFDFVKLHAKLSTEDFDWREFSENLLLKLAGRSNFKMVDAAASLIGMLLEKKSNYFKRYSEVGWGIVDKALVFKYDKIYSKANIEGSYQEDDYRDIKAILPEDQFASVADNIVGLMSNSNFNKVIMGASVSGVVRQILNHNKESGLNINITGEPATGKTTFCRYALSLFGDPDRLEGSFIDTINSVPEVRVLKPVLPYVLDERMLKYFGMSREKETRNIIADIFREYEGRNRRKVQRLAIKFIAGPLISTSVQSLKETIADTLDLGQFRRILEFRIEKEEIFKDKEEAIRYGLLSKSEKGVGVRLIIDYLFNNFVKPDDIYSNMEDSDIVGQDIIEKMNDRFYNLCREINPGLRKVGCEHFEQRFALIILSCQILREALEYILSCLFKEMMDFKKNFDKEYSELNISSEVNIEEDLAKERFGELLYNKYYKNFRDENFLDNLFSTSEIYKDSSKEILEYLIDNVKVKKISVWDALIKFIEENRNELCIEKKTTDSKEKDTEEKAISDRAKRLSEVLKIEEDDNIYIIKTIASYGLANLLLKERIPSLLDICEYVMDAELMDSKKGKNSLYVKMQPLKSISNIEFDGISIVGTDNQVNVDYGDGKKQRSHVIKIKKKNIDIGEK